eukprot:CAMPEP_0197851880 /NCGR_PEP_ID=MMETSP1438-20131217/19122_1 /TAXON_ID=1461541 /ORGANISM="Pterosperma sp., Strain CCMP1384" /LENGTH=287 /DNA_ID=CAMNT_0043465657 /DNA_START=162 /DNA_END=1025 /DNA_ORIENTATION=+
MAPPAAAVSQCPLTGKTQINIAELPHDVQKYMTTFDTDHDGLIDVKEFTSMARQYQGQDREVRLFRKLGIMLVLGIVVLSLIGFGLSFAVYELSKETTLDEDGTMRAFSKLHAGQIVKTDNSDVSTHDNTDILVNRHTGNPVSVGPEAGGEMDITALNSNLDDMLFKDLRNLELHSVSGGSVYLKVHGFHRGVSADKPGETYVVLRTDAGRAYLHGAELTFDNELAEVMNEVGFASEKNEEGRHLLFFDTVLTGLVWVAAAGCVAASQGACIIVAGPVLFSMYDDDR